MLARRISADLKALEPIMDSLCAATCRHCPEPCCLSAKVWYDFKDLLYLHLASLPIAESQPMQRYDQVCSHWRPDGCRIVRSERPWICTWYLCPAQTARLQREQKQVSLELSKTIQAIKNKRLQLENAFIRLAAGYGDNTPETRTSGGP
jgi:hypothetical protein